MTTRSRRRGEIRKGLVKFDRYKRTGTERALIPRIREGAASLFCKPLLSERGKNLKVRCGIRTASKRLPVWKRYQLSVAHRITKLSFYPTINSEISSII